MSSWFLGMSKNEVYALHWRHNEHDGFSNHEPHDCLHICLFRRRSKKISKFRVTGLCAGNSAVTGEFSTQKACNAENVSIWWRHHGTMCKAMQIIRAIHRKRMLSYIRKNNNLLSNVFKQDTWHFIEGCFMCHVQNGRYDADENFSSGFLYIWYLHFDWDFTET